MQPSFQVCNQDLEIQPCAKSNQNPNCGIFSFNDNATGNRLYGKSCVHKSYCEDIALFCGRWNGTATHCELECCNEELCNDNDENNDAEGCDWVESTGSRRPSWMASRFPLGACAVYIMAMTI